MSTRRRTAFDRYVAGRMKSREFAEAHREAKAEIDATDRLMRRLDEAREQANLSKAELARRVGMPAETIRKLFTADGVNPTMSTVSRIAAELGLSLTLSKA